jgi:hypothetical protein
MFYRLVDHNENFYNCGHYAEWVVEEREGELPVEVPKTRRGTPLAYADKTQAEEVACRLNKASAKAWREFLNS